MSKNSKPVETKRPESKKLTIKDLAQVTGGRAPDSIKYEICGGGSCGKYES